MKKIFILFSLIIHSLSSYSQMNFVTTDKEKARDLANIIAGDKYKFKNEESKGKYNYRLNFISSENKSLTINFRIKYIGENEDLNIVGTPEYHLLDAHADFLDLYPFWKTYIDPESDKEDIVSKKAAFIRKDGKRYLLKKSSDKWWLSIHDI